MLDLVGLPKNVNGFRTTHTCELCGFEPKTKNKYREKQDHLVMKHFKEKIDKIFPHCRPYCCPTGDCAFTGKDKQALLRHYTGKHGILDKYLREALAEKGINYSQDSSKRKNSAHNNHSSSSSEKHKQPRLASPPSTSSIPTTLYVQGADTNPIVIQSRPNTEELRKEVEAMMASFQPVETQVVLALPNQQQQQHHHHHQHDSPTHILPDQDANNDDILHSSSNNNIPIESITLPQILASSPRAPPQHHTSLGCPPSQLMQQITVLPVNSLSPATHHQPPQPPQPPQQQRPITTASISPPPQNKTPLPSIRTIVSQVPLEVLTGSTIVTTTSATSAVEQAAASVVSSITTPVSLSTCHLGPQTVVENGEIMWGSGATGSLPAVVVEAANSVAYIETADGTYTAASIDNIDEYLYATTVNSSEVRERQLDFCML